MIRRGHPRSIPPDGPARNDRSALQHRESVAASGLQLERRLRREDQHRLHRAQGGLLEAAERLRRLSGLELSLSLASAFEARCSRAHAPRAVRGDIAVHGPVAYAQALLAALRGDAPAARERFDAALGVAREMGAAPWIARIARDRERSAID